jgi:hypothetical protein
MSSATYLQAVPTIWPQPQRSIAQPVTVSCQPRAHPPIFQPAVLSGHHILTIVPISWSHQVSWLPVGVVYGIAGVELNSNNSMTTSPWVVDSSTCVVLVWMRQYPVTYAVHDRPECAYEEEEEKINTRNTKMLNTIITTNQIITTSSAGCLGGRGPSVLFIKQIHERRTLCKDTANCNEQNKATTLLHNTINISTYITTSLGHYLHQTMPFFMKFYSSSLRDFFSACMDTVQCDAGKKGFLRRSKFVRIHHRIMKFFAVYVLRQKRSRYESIEKFSYSPFIPHIPRTSASVVS